MLKSIYRSGRRALKIVKNRAAAAMGCPVVVLVYHRVTNLPFDPQLLAVSPENFRDQLNILKECFPIISIEEDWSAVREPSVAVTFDDGYADNALEALPILEEVGIPATFFVTTGYVGTPGEFWWDELEDIILAGRSLSSRFQLRDQRYGRTWPADTIKDRDRLYRELHLLMKKVDAGVRDDWMQQLREWAGKDAGGRASHRAMSAEELNRLAGNPLVTIGAHTVTHTPMASQTPDRQRLEIKGSKVRLEGWLKKEIHFFSYPFGGRSDYTGETVRMVREAGFQKAFSNFSGQWHRWTNPFQIPRQLVRNWDGDNFRENLKRFWVL